MQVYFQKKKKYGRYGLTVLQKMRLTLEGLILKNNYFEQ